jgi:hypothetical protein
VDATRAVVRLENRFAEALKREFRRIKNAVADKLPELRPEAVRPKLTSLKLGLPLDVVFEPVGSLAFRKVRLPEAVKQVSELEGLLELIDPGRLAELVRRFTLEASRKGVSLAGSRNKLEDAPDEVSLDLEEFLKLNASQVAAGVAASMKDSLRQALIEGISTGETIPQLMRRIEAQLDSVAAVNVRPATDALGRVIRAGHIRTVAKETAAETIARTEANRAYNLGNLDALEQAGVGRVVWLLAPDACSTCRRLSESVPGEKSGRVMSLDEARDLIPAHYNCRCSVSVQESAA